MQNHLQMLRRANVKKNSFFFLYKKVFRKFKKSMKNVYDIWGSMQKYEVIGNSLHKHAKYTKLIKLSEKFSQGCKVLKSMNSIYHIWKILTKHEVTGKSRHKLKRNIQIFFFNYIVFFCIRIINGRIILKNRENIRL